MPDGTIICLKCFREMGQKALASSREIVRGDRKKLLHKWAKEEYAESVPRDVLRTVVEHAVRNILTKGDPEVEFGNATTRLQFVTGMQVEEAKLTVVRELRKIITKGLYELERESLDNIKRLHDLGTQD